MKIYDNGEILLGTKEKILNYMKHEQINWDEGDYKEIFEYLEILKDKTIVAINYSFGMGLTFQTWEDKDIMEV